MPSKKQSGWLAGLLAALATAFGIHHAVTTPSTGHDAPADTATHAPPLDTVKPAPVDTPVTPPIVTPPATTDYITLRADSVNYTSTAQLLARITKNIPGGTGTANLLYTDGANASLVSLDTVIRYRGRPTIKYTQPGGVANTPQLSMSIPASKHVWVRAVLRWSPGWSTMGTGMTFDGTKNVPSSAAYKMLAWGFQGYDASGRVEITNGTQYQVYWGAKRRSDGVFVVDFPGEKGVAGYISTEWADGGWYQYILDIDYSQGKTGVVRLYMAKDGQTPTLKVTTQATTTEAALPLVDRVIFGLNYNQIRQPGQEQSINYAITEIVDGTKYANPFGVR